MNKSKKIHYIGLGLILLGLFISVDSSYAQHDARRDVEYVENEGHDSEELENVINDYEKKNSKMIDALNEMNQDGNISAAEQAKIISMYSGGKPGEKVDMSQMISKMIPAIKMINQRFGSMSYDAARAEIESSILQTPAKPIFKAMPKGIDFVTALVRDDKALIASTGMFKDKEKLLHFFIANVAIFILGFFILRKSKDARFIEKLSKWAIKKVLLTSVRIGLLVYFFGNDLGPTWKIFRNTFL